MRGNLKFRVRQLATALLASAALVAVAGLAGAAWDGTQEINLGDKISAEFAVNDTFHHEFSFYAPKDTMLNIKVKAATGLALDFKLYNQLDAEQPLGTTVSAAGIKNFKILADAYYTLHVTADAGAGIYELTTTGKFPTKIAGTVTADTPFGAMKGALASASVKPSKTGPGAATITSVKLPGGVVAGVTAGVPSFKNLTLPKSTTYTLDLTFTTAGNVDISIGLKTKLAKRTWSFGLCTVPPGTPVGVRADWLNSPHNDSASEAFRHWDSNGAFTGSNVSCAKCHSSGGYQDWLGADGSAFEVMNATSIPLGTTVDCDACHNSAATALSTALFPSGDRIDNLGPEARCMQCHQGRESTVSMDTMINTSALADDAVCTGPVPSGQAGAVDKLSFKNVHYFAAAATLYGREVRVGYQYSGKDYNGRLEHVQDYRTCVQCHDQHSTELRLTECAQCHAGVTDYASLKNIRMERSVYDYDGDGNTTEGMALELKGLADSLYAAMQAYGIAKTTPIVYDPAAYPYWFNDVNPRTSFAAWTPRLVRAAYNYQYYQKDPGAFAHNSRYVMQLLYDGIESFNAVAPVPNFAMMVRGDTGHFDALGMPWRDWDKALGDSDPQVRRAAILALGECAPADTALLVPALARGVREDRDRACRNFAVVVLGRMGGVAARDALSRCYALGDRGERNFAALGLGILGRGLEDADARDRIAAALRSDFINREDSDFRGALAISLGLLRDAKAIPPLRAVLKDRGDPELRAHCALALGLMGRMDAVPDLRAALLERGSPALQREAALALGILGDAGASKVLSDLLAASGPEHVRASAARALGELGGETAADALLALLGDRSASGAARGQAAVGLGIILDARRPGALSSLSAGLDFLATTPAITEALSIP